MATKLTKRGKQIRRDVIKLAKRNGGYHFGGCFSCVEILMVLFDSVMGPEDEFILSKGHACWPYYLMLMEKGYKPKLESHPSRDPVNGIKFTTGSLGHGLPMAIGVALARKQLNQPGKVYVLMGDGEIQCGTTWESLLIAYHHRLDNLCIIMDLNGIQGSGHVHSILPNMWAFLKLVKTTGFMWSNVSLGHDLPLLKSAFVKKSYHSDPHIVLCYTTKGKGVSFMEDNPEWHAKWLDGEHEVMALEELR